MRLRMNLLTTFGLALMLSQVVLRAETKREAPDFKEVYDLIRAHLGGMSEDDLNRKAARGLVNAHYQTITVSALSKTASRLSRDQCVRELPGPAGTLRRFEQS